MSTVGTARQRVTDLVTYLRARGPAAVVRKLTELYVYDRQRVYITRGQLEDALQRPPGRAGVEVTLARRADAARLTAFPRFSERWTRAWLDAGHYLVVAWKDGVPAGYRQLARRVPPAMAPVLALQPDELFSTMVYVQSSFRRQGIHTHLTTATAHLLHPLGYRRVWGSQSPFNHTVHESTHRPTHVTKYIGTLTRHAVLGHVRFSFVPTTSLSRERLVQPVEILTAALGRVRRVEILLNRVSVTVTPGAVEAIAASLQLELGVTAVRETADQVDELRGAFDRVVAGKPDALVVLYDPMLLQHRRTLVALAAAQRLPAVYEGTAFAMAGGLFACGARVPPLATLPDRLQRLAIARDREDLVVNLGLARRLGITVPSPLLERADRVLV